MLRHRNLLWGLVIAANLMAAASVQAQWQQDYPAVYQPFTDFNWEQYDYQWFAPAITEQYGEDTIDPNTGLFFEYHRLFMNVTRSDEGLGPFEGDSTYGNRVDFGYMTEDQYGWLFSWWRLDGPTFNDYNRGDFNSFEVNRTVRLDQFHRGFWVEPMIGVRVAQFNDKTSADNLSNPVLAFNINNVPTSQSVSKDFRDDVVSGDITVPNLLGPVFIQNTMLLGQLGVRAHSHRGSWSLNGEARVFAGPNWIYRGDYDDYEETAYGGEFSIGAAYHVTREITLDVSWDTLYYGDGIGRNPFIGVHDDQSMIFSGVAFGFTLNR